MILSPLAWLYLALTQPHTSLVSIPCFGPHILSDQSPYPELQEWEAIEAGVFLEGLRISLVVSFLDPF